VAKGEELHMTQFRRLARGSTLAVAVLCAFVAAETGLPRVGYAKAAKPAPAQASQPSDKNSKDSQDEARKKAARAAYDAGLKQFANGHYQPAIEQLSAALKSGGLSSAEMAKALYRRGIAYKRQKQPGLAISDLTSALWLKNGLSGNDRDTATAERADAYKMAGIEDTGKGPTRVIGETTSGANASSAGLSAAAIAQAAARNANSGNSASVTRQDESSAAAVEAARARAAYAPVDSLAGSTVTANRQASAPAAPSSSIGSSVKGFFSNLFGGSSGTSANVQAPAGVTTASTGPSAPETSSWSSATVVKAGAAHRADVRAARAATHATKGKYKIHIAALRSRAEAEALAQKIEAQHAADLNDHVPTVDKKVIGSMGTFYRVRIGGYASQDEPRGLCNKLRTSGLDCLVVTN
jgi:hypothetical protein